MKSNKTMRIVMVVVVVALVGGAIYGFNYLRVLREYRAMIAGIEIESIDLSRVKDGVYTGSSEAVWVAADVKVTVKDHRITDIELVRHKNGRGEAAEVIPDRVVESQSLQVDIIAGVTSSCKVILEAIEEALVSGIE